MSVRHFVDEELEYRTWQAENPNGHVLNTYRVPSAKYLVLHSAGCRTISGEPTSGRYWTKDYSKVCAKDRLELENWAERTVNAAPQPCGFCHPV